VAAALMEVVLVPLVEEAKLRAVEEGQEASVAGAELAEPAWAAWAALVLALADRATAYPAFANVSNPGWHLPLYIHPFGSFPDIPELKYSTRCCRPPHERVKMVGRCGPILSDPCRTRIPSHTPLSMHAARF
jgi:hypothetical protein